MKLEAFMKMATKLKSMKPKYESCICSSKVMGWIKMHAEKGKVYYGLRVFEEKYFPDEIWLLDKDYTKIYIEKGLAGLIARIADINLLPIYEAIK